VIEIKVRTEADAVWKTATPAPVWRGPRDSGVDAVLIRVAGGRDTGDDVTWADAVFADNVEWMSSGYPHAAAITQNGETARKTVGFGGLLYAAGGGGQGAHELDLSVNAPPKANAWSGVSGAPVFVQGRLAGIIKEVPESFEGGRLAGVPATSLLSQPGFLMALARPWLDAFPSEPWVLVVQSEHKKGNLGEWVDGSLEKRHDAIKDALVKEFAPISTKVRIAEALESPGSWLKFVRALCVAPIAIFDATGFEPAVMLALGVRAVVRRGVTLTSTADDLKKSTLSTLPFNIQESKLIHHGSGFKPYAEEHPHNRIASAIVEGWREFGAQPRYLDLPAYDAVRCAVPTTYTGASNARDRVLVLCFFDPSYEDGNWLTVSNALSLHYPLRPPARMLDIPSPRLVGQALYESIRWARTCVVDWTAWRGNVFFEMGVRLACADTGPVGIIERGAYDAASAPGALMQEHRLIQLFQPTSYDVDGDDEPIRSALRVHDEISRNRPPALPVSALPHDATFKTCQEAFDWRQEDVTLPPHDALRRSIEAPFGKDQQAVGRSPILFSTNEAFRRELDRSVQERWVAAWYYLRYRYPKSDILASDTLRASIQKLGNDVLQFGLRDVHDASLVALREEIYEMLDELDDWVRTQQTKDTPDGRTN
jgi:hypothetical protein